MIPGQQPVQAVHPVPRTGGGAGRGGLEWDMVVWGGFDWVGGGQRGV
jgi:hypothetical protein